MKNNNIIKIMPIILFALFTTACDWIDEDLNNNPSRPVDVAPSSLLPGAQASLAFMYGGDGVRYSSLWLQQTNGVARQSRGFSNYTLTTTTLNNLWNGYYQGTMMNFDDIIKRSGTESPHYAGVAKVLMAYNLGLVTDAWGRAPFTEAFQGNDNLIPAHEEQEVLYGHIFSLLNAAITDLAAATSLLAPGSDDFIYGGDLDQWTKAAYALKARHELHLSKRNGATAYTNALTALENAFASNADDMEFDFINTATGANPNYQFDEQRGDIRMGKYYIDLLNATSDPRLTVFATTAEGGGYVGGVAGAGSEDDSNIGSALQAIDAPVTFISYTECKFIEAEAKFQTGDAAGAATAYNDAVIASLAKYGVTDATWEATNAAETDATITLEKIMMAKYTALFMSFEAFNDWRRTGFPDDLVMAANASASADHIPRIYIYGSDEIDFNPNTTTTTINDRVWWDVE